MPLAGLAMTAKPLRSGPQLKKPQKRQSVIRSFFQKNLGFFFWFWLVLRIFQHTPGTYPWNIPQTPKQQFMKEVFPFGGGCLGYAPGVCWSSRRLVVESSIFSGDSWMYPYQRTPMGNPYISPIYPYNTWVFMGYYPQESL